jgi:YD repeat-containing protein
MRIISIGDGSTSSANSTAGTKRTRSARRVLALLSAALATAGLAATTSYQYDALGRMIQVNHNNGNVTTYTLDAAGNRTQVDDLLPVAPPTQLLVPQTSTTGNYSLSWSGGGTVASYELYESTSSSFSTQTRVYQGSGTNVSISGHGAGSFYYRVRGCTGSACTTYRNGNNHIVVSLAPPAPTGLQTNPNAMCTWGASWNASSGATYYTIRDWSGNFNYNVTTTSTSYSYCDVPGYTGNPNDYRPRWVKACNSSGACSQSNFP